MISPLPSKTLSHIFRLKHSFIPQDSSWGWSLGELFLNCKRGQGSLWAMKLVMAANLFFGMIHDILMEYYLQKYGYSCTGSYTMLPATTKLELVQSLKINYGLGILSDQISWWAFKGSCSWLFWRKLLRAVSGEERAYVSAWDEKPYEIVDNGKKAYFDEQDVVAFLDSSRPFLL